MYNVRHHWLTLDLDAYMKAMMEGSTLLIDSGKLGLLTLAGCNRH